MLFDGVTVPQVVVELAVGGAATVDPASGYWTLGTSQLDTTAVLGGIGWVDVAADTLSLSTQLGQSDEISPVSPGTARIVLDNASGAYDPGNSASPYAGLLDVSIPVWVKAVWQGTSYSLYRGVVDDITLDAGTYPTATLSCVDGLEVLGRAFVPAIAAAFDGDTTGTRIGRILDQVNWPTSLRSLDTGAATVQSTTYGDNALPLVQAVVDSELGQVAADADGRVAFFSRTHVYTATRSTTVQATLSDIGTDIDMLELAVSRPRGRIFNDARVTRTGGSEQAATNATSVAAHGIRTFPGQAGTLLRTDGDAYSLASWIVAKYAKPQTAVSSVRVDASTQGMWSALLPLALYDRVRAIRDYGPATIDVQLLVQGMAYDISDDAWVVTLSTRNTDVFVPWVLGTGQLGTAQVV